MPGTAVFDLDRTLTRLPTWTRFVYQANRHRPIFWLRLPVLVAQMLGYKLGLMDRTTIKNKFLATLAWAGRNRLEEAGKRFAEIEVQRGLRSRAKEQLDWHRARGDTLYMATAAIDFVSGPIADLLGFDGIICTRTAWPTNPKGVPVIDGLNCYDDEKFRQVKAAVDTGDIKRPLYFYSDHVSDLDLLVWADTGIAVNPSAKLRHAATPNGLITLDMDRDIMDGTDAAAGTRNVN